MAREGFEPPTRGFSVLRNQNSKPQRTVQVFSLQHLRHGVLSHIVCSCPVFGQRLRQRGFPPLAPPSNYEGRPVCKGRVFDARSHISEIILSDGTLVPDLLAGSASKKITGTATGNIGESMDSRRIVRLEEPGS
jgi:hypothetical protein